MVDLLFVFIAIAIGVGALLGRKTFKDNEAGKTQTNLIKIPRVGAMLSIDYWFPKNNHEKNIMIGKSVVMAYCLLGYIVSPYFFFLGIVPILYHIEWMSE